MATADQRISALETEVRVVNDSVKRLCEAQERTHELLHGKDTENPGMLIEVDRLKGFRKRVGQHINWLWSAITGVCASVVAAVVAWALNHFGDKS